MHAPLSAASRVEWRALAGLGSVAAPWQDLAERTLEPNVFYEPAFARPAASVFGGDVGAALVWSAAGRLAGLFPARIARWRSHARSAVVGWTHPFAPLGVPLVDRDQPEAVIAAWLDHLASDARLPPRVLLPLTPEGGPFAAALDVVLARTGRRGAGFGRHRRAQLAPGAQRDRYIERAVPARRRKELRRLRRRLTDVAPVSFVAADTPAEVGRALQDFLVLEASGWKGVAGTAAVNDPAVRTFVETAVGALAARGQVRVDRLLMNRCSIAAAVTLRSGTAAWCWKIAYSEGVAYASPGVQLMLDLTPSLLADEKLERIDSCATAGHPMIDHLWRERLTMVDRLIELRRSPWPFALACGAETMRRSAFDAAKALRSRLPRR
jgi:CelD/BcsL family acetyltransferase involved in cellulose biosynthesis